MSKVWHGQEKDYNNKDYLHIKKPIPGIDFYYHCCFAKCKI
ncbi:MAG TPA: hypothetical protein VNS08_07465 [Ureibacillus sp.]|nr:hypothetical protein [Ureibacillus sp.]